MAAHPVAANLLMVALVAGGLMMAFRVRQEVFPEFSLDVVGVSVTYPGASPEEVEEGIVVAVEDGARERRQGGRAVPVLGVHVLGAHLSE